MKSIKNIVLFSSLLLLSLSLASCITDTSSKKQDTVLTENSQVTEESNKTSIPPPAVLPVKYQTANYFVEKEPLQDTALKEESVLKVGAKITSTSGPQPLWDILKRLTALKQMNVSWASDVDQNVLVDVNIGANDDFFQAIDNLLRQVDYYHEVQGTTVIVKYKETRQFHISMPFIKQTYKTNTGGDVLGGTTGSSTNVAGEIKLSTEGVAISNLRDGTPGGVEFNTWNSIENNLNSILNIWSTDIVEQNGAGTKEPTDLNQDRANRDSQTDTTIKKQEVSATFRRSSGGNSYFIDKPVGLVTVTAPRPVLEKLDTYFKTLKKELYKQISIEAKILEVQLDDSSSIGLNWNMILKNLSVAGGVLSGGKTYGKTNTDTTTDSNTTTNTYNVTDTSTTGRDKTYDFTAPDTLLTDTGSLALTGVTTSAAGSAASTGITAATVLTQGVTGALSGAISLAAFSFDSFLHAVSEQGQTTILSNPKLSVLNGQPSLMTVGRNVTYIDKITSDVDGTTGTVTYTAETARALSGVGLALTANILDDNEIILNLVPVTSELVEPIEYRAIGLGEVGLPIINVREMSTTVRVKNGEMLVIGGLISSVKQEEGTFVPGTSSIPFFKYLFGYETKTDRKRELIILLKPVII